jgi:uncharacterized protein (DUF433 family)
MDWSGYRGVEVIEGKVSGVPLLKGTRMPADQVAEGLELGRSPEEIASDHGLKLADVLGIQRFMEAHQPTPHR